MINIANTPLNNNIVFLDKYLLYKIIINKFNTLKQIYTCDYDYFCISISSIGIESMYKKNIFITNSKNVDQVYLKENLLMHDPIPIIEQNIKCDTILCFNECYEFRSEKNKKINGNMLREFLNSYNIYNGVFYFFVRKYYIISYRFVCDFKNLKISRYSNFCNNFIEETIKISEELYLKSLELNIYISEDISDECKEKTIFS